MSKGLMQWSRGEAGARGRGAQTWGPKVVGGCGVWGGRGRCSLLTLRFLLLVPFRDVEIPCLVHPLLPTLSCRRGFLA